MILTLTYQETLGYNKTRCNTLHLIN